MAVLGREDSVAWQKSGARGRRPREHVADRELDIDSSGKLFFRKRPRRSCNKRAGDKYVGEEQVHRDAGDEHNRLRKARFRRKGARVPSFVEGWVFAINLHEPAEGQPVERVGRLADFPEHKRARRIPEPELVHAHPRELCRDKVS